MQYVVKMLTLYSYLPSSQTHYFQLLPFSWLCVCACVCARTHRSCAGGHGCCVVMVTLAMPYPEDRVSWYPSLPPALTIWLSSFLWCSTDLGMG